MARRAFVSYARDDAVKVGTIERRLRQLDIEVWIDQVLKGGQAWWDEILRQIETCDVFVAIVSPASMDSRACARERAYAAALGKPILPVALTPPSQAMPSELTKRQVVDYSVPSEDAAFRLASALMALPAAGALPDPMPEPPDVPLSYLAAMVDMASGTDTLTRAQQLDMLNDLEPGLRAADLEEREGAWHVLQLLEDRPDLLADAQRRIDRLRDAYSHRAPEHPEPEPAAPAPPANPAPTYVPPTRPAAPERTSTAQQPPPQPSQRPAQQPVQQPAPQPVQQPAPQPPPTSTPDARGRGFSIAAIAFGLVSVLFFPIVFGPVAIVLAVIALVRKERWGGAAIAVALGGTVLGFVLGALVAGG